ncbi:glycosyltransferase, partial [Paludibacteraceae bacterium OttesenSCG-928-F17]|nr:glycosyltransferase [Paludibacteraceae bacterium OttesenSCG-928-F17]
MSYKVTIAIPIYNVGKYIERCARSLFEQTFDSIQYVFVNDCTPDNSIDILEKTIEEYPHRKKDIQIIHHEANKGLAGARITALNAARGEYILNTDSDDYIDLRTVELMYNKATEDDSDIVVCDMMMLWNKRKKVFYQPYSADNIEYTKLLLDTSAMPGVVNKLIRTSLYRENNVFPIEGINMGEDYVTTPRLAYYAKRISKIDLPLYYYSQTNESAYTKKYSKKSADNLIKAIHTLEHFFENTPEKNLFEKNLLQGKL